MTAPQPGQPLGTLIASWHGNWIAGDGYAAPAHLLAHVGTVAGRLFIYEHGVVFASAREAAVMQPEAAGFGIMAAEIVAARVVAPGAGHDREPARNSSERSPLERLELDTPSGPYVFEVQDARRTVERIMEALHPQLAAPAPGSPSRTWDTAPRPPEGTSASDQRRDAGSTTAVDPTDLGALVLRPSKRKWLGLALAGAMFTAAGVVLLSGDDPRGWLAIAVFGPATLVPLWILIPGTADLRLGPDGFVAKAVFRTLRYSWDDVDNFRVHSIRTQVRGTTHTSQVIAFDLAEGVAVPGSLSRLMTRPQEQFDCALPDSYGRRPDQLAQLMQRYRDRYAPAPPS